MRLFDAVKSSVTAIQAAKTYGIEVRRGMCCCPFHNDKNPSAKVDERFHCFGCGADYSVIDFTAELFGLSAVEAAKKLAYDFGIPYDNAKSYRPSTEEILRQRAIQKQRDNSKRFDELVKKCFFILRDYYFLLTSWRKDHAPQSPAEELHPLFCEALKNKDFVDWALDVLTVGTAEEKSDFIAEFAKGVLALEKRIRELAAGKAG